MKKRVTFFVICITIILFCALQLYCPKDKTFNVSLNLASTEVFSKPISAKKVIILKEVLLENYFNYLDSVVEG